MLAGTGGRGQGTKGISILTLGRHSLNYFISFALCANASLKVHIVDPEGSWYQRKKARQ